MQQCTNSMCTHTLHSALYIIPVQYQGSKVTWTGTCIHLYMTLHVLDVTVHTVVVGGHGLKVSWEWGREEEVHGWVSSTRAGRKDTGTKGGVRI